MQITITDEQTIELQKNEVVEALGVVSFQNTSNHSIFWSTKPITDVNKGGLLLPTSERVLSSAMTVYFISSERANVHCRAISL